MDTELTTVIGQLSIKDERWRSEAPNQVAVREPAAADAPGAGKGDLFIITEIQGNVENLEAMEQRLAEAIRDSYYLARGSITASLRRAVQMGSDLLYKRNRKVDVEERVVGGAVVLVLSNEDAFVAQVGPTAFFAILGDHIQRYPNRSVWLDEALGPNGDDVAVAMGLSSVVEPALHHLRVAPEDILVLADSRFAGQLPLKSVVRAVSSGDVKATVKNLGDAAKARDCSALVLEVIEATPSASKPAKIAPPPQLSNLWSRAKGRREEAVAVAVEPVEAVATAEETSTAAIFASTATLMQKPLSWLGNLTGKAAPEPAAVETIAAPEPARQEAPPRPMSPPPPVATPEPAPVEADEPTAEAEPPPHYYRTVYNADSLEEEQDSGGGLKLGAAFLSLIALVGGGLRKFFGIFVRSEDEPRIAGTQAQQPQRSFSWKTLRNVAIAIPILVAIIVGVNYLREGQLRETEYQEYITSAQSKFEQAQAVEPASALALMAEAENALVQAEQIKPDQPEIADLRQQMAVHADSVTKIQRLYYLPQVRQYTDPGTDMAKIEVQGVEIYVMDTGNDRVFHHRLDDLGDALLPDDETVLMTAKGQGVDDITVAEMLAMTWMPTGGNRQTSDLVILNSAGLLEYNPNWGITSSALASTDILRRPVAVSSYFGNFYILDPEANVLLRYLPTTDGYNAPPQNYFPADKPENLSNAIDMAIDGAIYVLFKDGQLKKYLSGEQVDFNVSGLDVPLKDPVALYTAPDEEVQFIYVADAGNQRIVQLNKDGSFVRQFKPRAGEGVTFGNLQDIYVDEIGGRLLILDSNNLYLGKLPTE